MSAQINRRKQPKQRKLAPVEARGRYSFCLSVVRQSIGLMWRSVTYSFRCGYTKNGEEVKRGLQFPIHRWNYYFVTKSDKAGGWYCTSAPANRTDMHSNLEVHYKFLRLWMPTMKTSSNFFVCCSASWHHENYLLPCFHPRQNTQPRSTEIKWRST